MKRLEFIGVMVAWCAAACSFAQTNGAAATVTTVDYMIVVTGAELLAGAYPDAHTFFLTQTLHPLGYHCIGSLTVDDRHEDIDAALDFALRRAPLAIVTGGLGPTDNDITRQTLAEYTHIPVEEHPDVIGAMEKRVGVTRDRLRANLRQQARVPVRGTYLPSAQGTAVGLVFEWENRVIVALPGPPRELQPMVRAALIPFLTKRFGTHAPGCSVTLRFVGLGQSQIDETLDQRVHLPADVMVSSRFEGGRVDFSFLLPVDTPENRARLEELKGKIRQHLGDRIYADDGAVSLEDAVAARLDTRHARIALAEVGSGGSLAASLSAASAAPRVLQGAFVSCTDDGLRGLLRVGNDAWRQAASAEDRVKLFAAAASQLAQSDYAIAVGQVEARDGGRSVLVALRGPDGQTTLQRLGVDGDPARTRLLTPVWDQLRRQLP